ncbi:MAG: hypothetical protein ACUVRV_12210 [Cyanobacteriota bacterium]
MLLGEAKEELRRTGAKGRDPFDNSNRQRIEFLQRHPKLISVFPATGQFDYHESAG